MVLEQQVFGEAEPEIDVGSFQLIWGGEEGIA